MNQIFKRVLSGVLSAVITISAIPFTSTKAEENNEPSSYTMFATSSDDGAITVNASNSNDAGLFVGTTSDSLNIPYDEWQYMKDENENDFPDFFENSDN